MSNDPRVLLSFDFGTKRIGVAVGQMVTGTASPIGVVRVSRGMPDWEAISGLVEHWQPDALVVGIPLSMDGTPTDATEAAQRFSRQLSGRYRLEVHEVDERLSSVEARQLPAIEGDAATGNHRHTSGEVDAIAAKLILETWLAEKRAKPSQDSEL